MWSEEGRGAARFKTGAGSLLSIAGELRSPEGENGLALLEARV